MRLLGWMHRSGVNYVPGTGYVWTRWGKGPRPELHTYKRDLTRNRVAGHFVRSCWQFPSKPLFSVTLFSRLVSFIARSYPLFSLAPTPNATMLIDRAAVRNVRIYDGATGASFGGMRQNGSITEVVFLWILNQILPHCSGASHCQSKSFRADYLTNKQPPWAWCIWCLLQWQVLWSWNKLWPV